MLPELHLCNFNIIFLLDELLAATMKSDGQHRWMTVSASKLSISAIMVMAQTCISKNHVQHVLRKNMYQNVHLFNKTLSFSHCF